MKQKVGRSIGKKIAAGVGFSLLAALLGCGGQTQAATGNVQGIFVDSKTVGFLQSQFDETKSCTGLSKGSFNDLSIVMMPPSFPCPYYASGCSGEFSNPNSIKIGLFNAWKHEVVHYLLYVNTGSPDTDHVSPFFNSCAI